MRLLALSGSDRALCVGKIAKRGLQGLKNPYNEHRSIAMRLRQNMLTMLAQVVELVDTLL